jgi:mannose-6-phosphate isomerase-like protein (cupin superfamily)
MRITPADRPVTLGPDVAVHLDDELGISAFSVTTSFWAHDTHDRPELANGRILSLFDYTTTWPYWERHPTGDELVYLVAGDVALHLGDGQHRRTVALKVGEAAVIPAGTWHRAIIHAPSRVLFVTPTPERTQQRAATAHDTLPG